MLLLNEGWLMPGASLPCFTALCSFPLSGCISAANGVGCILAELGNTTAAKEVFLQVGGCAPSWALPWGPPSD